MTGEPLLLRLQLQLCRDYSTGKLGAHEFIDRFIWLYGVDYDRPGHEDFLLHDWIGDVYVDLHLHNEFDEFRQLDEWDDEQLRSAIADRLVRWDAGTYPSPST